MATFFSDAFGLDKSVVDDHGAFDISIINDLPLFIDPFLLFHSDNKNYKALHESIISYLVFLRDRAASGPVSDGELRNWYCFPEVKQNWLGFSMVGNGGAGLGMDFASALHSNLNAIFSNFGEEKITKGSHLEKVCLISSGVGRDNISDFTTNLIQDFLCRYTEDFAKKHLLENQTNTVWINRAVFNYSTEAWERRSYTLPWYEGDFIVLTPKDILTRDDTWISRGDMISLTGEIPVAVPDQNLRAAVSNYFQVELERRKRPGRHPSQKDRNQVAEAIIRKFPELIDYYIKIKEDNGENASDISAEKVLFMELIFSKRLREILHPELLKTDFYTTKSNTYLEAHTRLAYLKHVIEDKGGWRVFYDNKGKPVERERDIQILYKLVWFGTPSDAGSEADDGRGPVDFKISRGRNKTLVEMKLAKNTQLERNLRKQVEIYQTASDAETAIKVITYFSYEQFKRVKRILERLEMKGHKDIVLIDARSDNKPSASKAA